MKFASAAIAATFIAFVSAEQTPETEVNKTEDNPAYVSHGARFYSPHDPYGYVGQEHGFYGHPAYIGARNESGEKAEDNKTEEDALVFYRRYGYYPAWYHHRTVTTHVYGDNEAGEEGNKTEEDALVFYRRYGYYPAWYHHRTVTTHVYGDNEAGADAKEGNKTEEDALVFYRRYGYYPAWYHHGAVTTTHVYGDNEAEQGNKTEEDALVFYRRYGYYPAWYHHRTVTTHVYGDNEAGEAEQGNKTEEDALVFFRRHGYYPRWYSHHYGVYSRPAFYDNAEKKQPQQNGIEVPKENKTEDDAVFVRPYGFGHPGYWAGHPHDKYGRPYQHFDDNEFKMKFGLDIKP